jgi:hypothetical protein
LSKKVIDDGWFRVEGGDLVYTPAEVSTDVLVALEGFNKEHPNRLIQVYSVIMVDMC